MLVLNSFGTFRLLFSQVYSDTVDRYVDYILVELAAFLLKSRVANYLYIYRQFIKKQTNKQG